MSRRNLFKKVLRFGRKGKLSQRLIGPYEVIEQIGPVAYRLLLPPELEHIHNVFHVSLLWKYRLNPSHVVPIEEIEDQSDLLYEEELIVSFDHQVKVLCNKTVPLVKVLWHNHKTKEATWKSEDIMKRYYLYLFDLGKF
ncbi:uncharacterized protein [Gossypium hirsutum]|uniref:Tf2-1-like SH3-like domain-containing protein n=1 Tax=Gossypium hirsutum TaxID=3635 RepID=A0A1U8NGP7_GOSHI|nr:uncharacterized protein LOC107947055 [Gossypium hirsutum]